MVIESATMDDVEAIATLVNSAYRGTGAQRGWTHEADYLAGQRTDAASLREALATQTILLFRDVAGGRLIGCVAFEPKGDGEAWSIGLLTVDPGLQAGGLGRQILAAAEKRATEAGARRFALTVVHVRDGLIAWYERRGYRPTGETAPFPYEDERFGRPLRPDLSFIVMEKRLPEAK